MKAAYSTSARNYKCFNCHQSFSFRQQLTSVELPRYNGKRHLTCTGCIEHFAMFPEVTPASSEQANKPVAPENCLSCEHAVVFCANCHKGVCVTHRENAQDSTYCLDCWNKLFTPPAAPEAPAKLIEIDTTTEGLHFTCNLSGSGGVQYGGRDETYFFRLDDGKFYYQYTLTEDEKKPDVYVAGGGWGKLRAQGHRGWKQEQQAQFLSSVLLHKMEEILKNRGWKWVGYSTPYNNNLYQRPTPENTVVTICKYGEYIDGQGRLCWGELPATPKKAANEASLTIREAIEALNGHAILSVDTARSVCSVLEVGFPENEVMSWQTKEEALQKYQFYATQAPSSGVDGRDLSYHVAHELGLGAPGYGFIGKGYQARANQRAIRQHLSQIGKL